MEYALQLSLKGPLPAFCSSEVVRKVDRALEFSKISAKRCTVVEELDLRTRCRADDWRPGYRT